MITAIVGKPGSGKTLQIVRLAKQFLNKGRDVYTNVPMNEDKMKLKKKHGKFYYFRSIKEFTYIFDGIVLLDELGGYFDSRDYMKFPPEVRVKLQQYRKDGVDVYYSVQSYSRAEKIIRELTNFVIECHNIFGIFWVTEYYPEDYEQVTPGLKEKSRGSFMYFGTKNLYACYDTKWSINRVLNNSYKFQLMSQKILELKGGENNG